MEAQTQDEEKVLQTPAIHGLTLVPRVQTMASRTWKELRLQESSMARAMGSRELKLLPWTPRSHNLRLSHMRSRGAEVGFVKVSYHVLRHAQQGIGTAAKDLQKARPKTDPS